MERKCVKFQFLKFLDKKKLVILSLKIFPMMNIQKKKQLFTEDILYTDIYYITYIT